jgi:ABC-type spermidine/putrescine transport system permease subunit II
VSAAVRVAGRSFRGGIVGVVLLFLFAPTAVMALESFSAQSYLSFPPRHFGLRQYDAVLFGSRWIPAFERSLVVAAAASIAALVIGSLAVVGMSRARVPFKRVFQVLALGPLLVPALAYAIALYVVFARYHLLGSREGLMLSHAVLGLPFVVLVVGAAIRRIPPALEEAAMSLGAGRYRALTSITARLLLPALGAALVLAFLTSFDEVVLTSFVGGIGYETLPRAILADVRVGVDPAITAVGMLLTGLTAVLLIALSMLRRKVR